MDCPKDQIQLIGDRPGQVLRHTGDYSKIKRVLGWKPQVSWEEGLKRTIQWYSENRDSWSEQLFMRKIPIITASGTREYH
jgi:dTDP-glucose 4,6-dehydratase